MIDNKNKNLLSFLSSKGFYFMFMISVLVITLTAFIITKRNITSYMENNSFDEIINQFDDTPIVDKRLALDQFDSSESAVTEETNEGIAKANDNVIEASDSDRSSIDAQPNLVQNTNANQEDTVQALVTESEEKIRLQMPVLGDILKNYSEDSLIYSLTLDQWTTHNGIDIKSDRGTAVKAAADGIVEKVYIDDMNGITIIIRHSDKLKTKYCNLSTDNMVQEGLNVNKGDVISGVGDTSLIEALDQSHLHFEVIYNMVNVNPSQYLE